MTRPETAHADTFVLDRLPPKNLWPELVFDLPELAYPERLNAAEALLEAPPSNTAIRWGGGSWSYRELDEAASRIARVLVEDLGHVPGNRVLLHGPNSPMTAAGWLAILKAGGITVATIPMNRAHELATVINKAEISHSLCDRRLLGELERAQQKAPSLKRIAVYGPQGDLEKAMAGRPGAFDAVKTFAHDPALLAFTSGTTGVPKACVHFHRDIMAMADTFARHVLKPSAEDIFAGTPPLSFTFGLGGLLVFPLRAGASSVLNQSQGIEALAGDIEKFKVTTLFTSPTAYRALLKQMKEHDLSSLKKCVSAGETLPKAVSNAWREATGIRIIDGIGSTEMIHIFVSASGKEIRPGATGKPVPGYQACLLGKDGKPLPAGASGRLAVKGPTGCRYLDDERQKDYVVSGWNVTGDIYRLDEDGYFWFVSRADDMILSGGYNIAGPEVENALLTHEAVEECAVVGAPDEDRGQIVKAFVVLKNKDKAGKETARVLQEHVKNAIAPYKYPRAVEFVDSLPKTQTGKIQRFRLRRKERESA